MKSIQKLKKEILLLIFSSFTVSINSQIGLPNVEPQSPEASSLTRAFDYPVSNCTGIPDISIPLYEIKSGQLSLPISISYHSSGRRVYDKTGAIGLGWILNAGGIISRTIYGDPDDIDDYIKFPNPWKSAVDLSNQNDYRFLAGIENLQFENIPQYDTEYDIFTYSVNGLSGNFILKDVYNTKIPTLIPKKPYKINWHQTYSYTSYMSYCDYFELIDDNGITYRFGKSIRDGVENFEYNYNKKGKSTWMLTEIISPNKEDVIYFKYKSFLGSLRVYSPSAKGILEYVGELENKPSNTDENNNITTQIYQEQRISEIIFRQGRIVFNLREVDGGPYNDNQLVNSIEIKNLNNETIKTIELNRSQLSTSRTGNLPTDKLDAILIKDKNLSVIEKYSFDYYPSPAILDEKSLDFWNYYNASGATNICPFSPTNTGAPYVPNPNANRTPNEEAMKCGVLKKIIYPTGGFAEFIYEINKYYDIQARSVKSCGGLRIYQVKTMDGNNNTSTRTFKYGLNEIGYGYLPLVPAANNMTYYTDYIVNYANQNDAASNTCYNTFDGSGYLPFFCTKMHYREITCLSDFIPFLQSIAQKPVIYINVTEYFGDLANNNGKIVYSYDRDDTWQPNSVESIFDGVLNYHLWERSDLLRKDIYLKTVDPSNPYKLIKYVRNIYNETEYTDEKINGLLIRKVLFANNVNYNPLNVEEFCAEVLYRDVFSFTDYTISLGKKELTGVVEGEIIGNSEFVTSTSFIYDENHLLKERIITDSKGESLSQEYRHPIFYSDTGAVYNSMKAHNIVNPVVELIERKNAVTLQYQKTNYAFFQGGSVIATSSVQTKRATGDPYETRLRYYDYDSKANLKTVYKENDFKTNYLYSYSSAYPIAKIENTEYATIEAVLGYFNIIDFSNKVSPYDYEIKAFLAPLYTDPRLKNAMITTFTYKPLIGITSQTDPNGVTVRYEYDDFSRLKLIRDNDNNIVKTYEYHYKP